MYSCATRPIQFTSLWLIWPGVLLALVFTGIPTVVFATFITATIFWLRQRKMRWLFLGLTSVVLTCIAFWLCDWILTDDKAYDSDMWLLFAVAIVSGAVASATGAKLNWKT